MTLEWRERSKQGVTMSEVPMERKCFLFRKKNKHKLPHWQWMVDWFAKYRYQTGLGQKKSSQVPGAARPRTLPPSSLLQPWNSTFSSSWCSWSCSATSPPPPSLWRAPGPRGRPRTRRQSPPRRSGAASPVPSGQSAMSGEKFYWENIQGKTQGGCEVQRTGRSWKQIKRKEKTAWLDQFLAMISTLNIQTSK